MYNSSANKVAILILAAGEASRMGSIKQLLPWHNTTLLGNAIKNAKQTRLDVYIILGANAQEIQKEIKEDVFIIINNNWKIGLGSSIASGVELIGMNAKDYDGVLVMLADQPFIDSSYLTKLIELFSKTDKGIIATNYGNKLGVPAIFSKAYFKELQRLNNDFGAKDILKTYIADSISIAPNGKEKDIDTVEDYTKFLK